MEQHEKVPEIDLKQAKRRARWRRNKEAERQRKAPPPSPPLPAEIIAEVWAERERRYERGAHYMWPVPGWHYGRGSWEFQCDVWAVKTLLAIQLHKAKPSPGMIARWMADHGLAHGYAHGEKSGSLRAMVGRALAAIAILETTKLRDWTEPAWPEFIPTLPLAPSIGVLKVSAS